MKTFFDTTKQRIVPFLDAYLLEQTDLYRPINRWAADTLKRLRATVGRGKMVRGSLVYMAYALAKKPHDTTCVRLASAMELVHTALVIHDDIMDGDGVRRGEPTVFRQYQTLARHHMCTHPDHVGESLGICAGDVALFLSFSLLASLPHSRAVLGQQLMRTFSEELSKVGFAQMQDVYAGSVSKTARLKDILNLYHYKTARYTFSLPLMLGGIAARMKPSSIQQLERLGEHLGIIFQIKDDELGMSGDEAKIGKPVGSDIREGKKTLYHHFLYASATLEEKKALDRIFGNESIGERELVYVRNLVEHYAIEKKINRCLKREIHEAERIIALLPFGSKGKQMLSELLAFNLRRVA